MKASVVCILLSIASKSTSNENHECFQMELGLPASRPNILCFLGGRGGLVVRSRPRDRRVAGSKPDSTEDPLGMGPVAR
ncbi:hypothetical protein AVEN_160878-1 [Araneus ventricosus]|uniref:Secreted protein n=1 Tax=Araneus ventricosus TaxID=182803 RepID=A0A4Y2NWR9_ARAVE|nr:hypothetical protein AVEN_160878-1 [Araneus ventricosus]